MPLSALPTPKKIRVDVSALPNAGRGVFASEPIEAGELIEQCPVVALTDPKDRDRLRKTGLVNYYFLWGAKRDHAAICLGWGAVYNHSFEPNAIFKKHIDDLRLDFTALRAIAPGEEILVNYNGDPENRAPILMPGIPAEAGGMPVSNTPRFIRGLTRRMRLLIAKLNAPGAGALAFACVGAA